MRNIQIIDGGENATFSIFQVTDDEFSLIFPGDKDIEISEDFHARVGNQRAQKILMPVWQRPILKRDAARIHGTLYYNWLSKRHHLPASKREVDWNETAINEAQRRLFRSFRDSV